MPDIDLPLAELMTKLSPTIFAAKHYGVPLDAAFLLSDFVYAALGREKGWPLGHHWHDWAWNTAIGYAPPNSMGRYPNAMAFCRKMRALYIERHRPAAALAARPALRIAAAQPPP